jgi:hypothetical protein
MQTQRINSVSWVPVGEINGTIIYKCVKKIEPDLPIVRDYYKNILADNDVYRYDSKLRKYVLIKEKNALSIKV